MHVLQTIVAGLVGTACMALLMTLIHRSGWANADMIRALGSLVTRSTRRSLGAGLVIHAGTGTVFAFVYVVILGLVGWKSLPAMSLIGAVMGLVHGIVVGYVLVAIVTDKHPVPKFQGAGLEVALAHVAGHVAYGLGVGLTAALLRIKPVLVVAAAL